MILDSLKKGLFNLSFSSGTQESNDMPLVAIEASDCPIQHEEGQDPQALPQTTEPCGPLESDVENEPLQSQTGNFLEQKRMQNV